MANINPFLRNLFAGDTVKDYRHAARIFLDNNYALSPKHSFLFHVAFDVVENLSTQARDQILEAGLIVKSAQLPKFTVDHKILNAYNRANIVQTKVKYDTITITFHDDNSDVIRNFWYDYYSYYYRDSNIDLQSQVTPHKYQRRLTDQWGYTLRKDANSPRLLQAVRIYSLHQKRFTEYLLVNPIITGWQGGEHNASESNGILQSSMTIAYESVIFSSGDIAPDTVKNFAVLHYDKTPSPLTPNGVGTAGKLSKGLVSSTDNQTNYLGQGNTGLSNAIFGGFSQSARNNNSVLTGNKIRELGNFSTDILQSANPFSRVLVPNASNLLGGTSFGGLTGRAAAIATGIPGANAASSLLTANSPTLPGSITSNFGSLNTPRSTAFWTSSKPPLPAVSDVVASASQSREFNARALGSAATVESAAINSKFIDQNDTANSKQNFLQSGTAQDDATGVDLATFLNSPQAQDDATGVDMQAFIQSGYAQDDSSGVDQAVAAQQDYTQDDATGVDQAVAEQTSYVQQSNNNGSTGLTTLNNGLGNTYE